MHEKKIQTKREEFLLLRIRAFQDKEAFRILIKEHGQTLLRFLHFKLPGREDAEDAYSSVCLQIWDYLTRTEVKHFTGLMFTVARAVVANFYDQRSKHPQVGIDNEDGTEIPIRSRDSVAELQNRLDVQFLEERMRELNDNERQMIILRYLEGYRVKDMAKLLGTTENTISVTLHRAIKKLRESYE